MHSLLFLFLTLIVGSYAFQGPVIARRSTVACARERSKWDDLADEDEDDYDALPVSPDMTYGMSYYLNLLQ
jgi:hypothetical protein